MQTIATRTRGAPDRRTPRRGLRRPTTTHADNESRAAPPAARLQNGGPSSTCQLERRCAPPVDLQATGGYLFLLEGPWRGGSPLSAFISACGAHLWNDGEPLLGSPALESRGQGVCERHDGVQHPDPKGTAPNGQGTCAQHHPCRGNQHPPPPPSSSPTSTPTSCSTSGPT